MSFLAIPYPSIDPIIFQVGPIAIRWYSLAYIGGLLFAWRYMIRLAALSPQVASREAVDDFLIWATLGVVLGGRVGYTLFYNFDYYADNPLAALQIWKGGMSFHGGVLGVIVSGLIFVKRRNIPALRFADIVACATPVGLMLGRLANFINGELFGRASDVPWAMVFPRGGDAPRHPSQLYEAFLEGLVLFCLLYLLSKKESIRNRPGVLTGVFLVGYALARAFVELFRQPDAHLGILAAGLTMGQWLSIPMILGGLFLITRAKGES
ncbi:MAG: prolipoprotein diacylglyceryl transferase [Rhodospirillaceae bacterium]|nr:prolipoprotein diacylglyceryl transferase [Rhodospirillaceae bacterium]MBL6930109.1 prolipoprotein diacylglyceryl transferase [Rhodospirillales bacterium]MBL6940736.1 prolipoprotein diacylglyceryl transferase [Rhodospirillales bacterium]